MSGNFKTFLKLDASKLADRYVVLVEKKFAAQVPDKSAFVL